jgi:hypothetical protein
MKRFSSEKLVSGARCSDWTRPRSRGCCRSRPTPANGSTRLAALEESLRHIAGKKQQADRLAAQAEDGACALS